MSTMRRFTLLLLATCVIALSPMISHARSQEPEREIVDARLEGYGESTGQPLNVSLEPGSTALSWFLFSFLAVVALSVMFKNARRTHLD